MLPKDFGWKAVNNITNTLKIIQATANSINFKYLEIFRMNCHLYILIFFSLIILTNTNLYSQNVKVNFSNNTANSENLKTEKGKLILQINNLKNDEGKIIFHLFNTETGKYFPTKSDYSTLRIDSRIKNNQVRIVIEDIPFGNYAYTIHHDENDNRKMDKTWLGFPAEGWGLSNDIMPVFSLPDFDEGKFLLNKSVVEINITLNY